MKRLINNPFGTKTLSKTHKNRRKLGLERLEDRQLMAANAIFNAPARQIEITGNAANDKVVVSSINNNTGLRITISELDAAGNARNSRQQDFSTAGVARLQFRGQDGNDQFYNYTSISAIAFGGSGTDKLYGGSGSSFLNGDGDSDTYYFFAGQGQHVIAETANNGTDYLDFVGLSQGVNIDLARTDLQQVTSSLRIMLASNAGIEVAMGTESTDTLLGNGLNNLLFGRGGNDYLEGRSGNDFLDGGSGSDTYSFTGSMLGSDTVVESAGVDADTLNFSGMATRVTVDVALTGSQSVASGMTLNLTTGTSIENVIGTMFNDSLRGNSRNNVLDAGAGQDWLDGRSGNDNLLGGAGSDTYFFGLINVGNYLIGEAAGVDTDLLDFGSFGSGITIDLALPGRQFVAASATVTMTTNSSIENVMGTSYADTLRGNSRANSLQGLDGNDTLEGRGGDDVLTGGRSNDTYIFRGSEVLGSDTIRELVNADADTLDFSGIAGRTGLNGGVRVDLGTTLPQTVKQGILQLTLANLTLDGSPAPASGIENVIGSEYQDTLLGNGRNNVIEGRGESDDLAGFGGNDTLRGGRGDDRLEGYSWSSGAGVDQLFGDEGYDAIYADFYDIVDGRPGLARTIGSRIFS